VVTEYFSFGCRWQGSLAVLFCGGLAPPLYRIFREGMWDDPSPFAIHEGVHSTLHTEVSTGNRDEEGSGGSLARPWAARPTVRPLLTGVPRPVPHPIPCGPGPAPGSVDPARARSARVVA